MPYFFIGPLYVVSFVGLLVLALLMRFIPRFRPHSADLAIGALGTVPGFIFGNAVFWAFVIGAGIALHKPLVPAMAGTGGGAFGFAAFFVAGLAVANLAGCTLGFTGGVWLRRKAKRPA